MPIGKRHMAGIAAGLLLAAASATAATPASAAAETLKDAYHDAFYVGVAINQAQFDERAPVEDAIIRTQFNSVSPENVLKWESVHPHPGRYDFSQADRYVDFAVKHHMYVVGHVLVWHNQTPDWVFRKEDGRLVSRKELLARLHNHIATVVGRYRGRIRSWDVVNEALNEDGTLRPSLWYKIIGPDYIAKAFEYAHDADPEAELTYNDYSIVNPPKRDGVVALIRKLKAEGAPITTIGIQGHYNLTWPDTKALADAITAFGNEGMKVAVSELDIDVLPRVTQQNTAEITLKVAREAKLDPYADGLPEEMQNTLAARYGALFAVCRSLSRYVDRVTLWGVTDGTSWENDWPVKGRTNYPLLFDRNGKPKKAFDAVLKAATP